MRTYVIGAVILTLLVISMFLYGYRYFQDRSRLEITEALGTPQNLSWEEVELYIDCELVSQGMTREEVKNTINRLGAIQDLNPPQDLRANTPMVIRFLDVDLADRYYYFQDGGLISVYRVLSIGLDAPERVSCN